jgi:POT family proton-dependent oligopeptide transporter
LSPKDESEEPQELTEADLHSDTEKAKDEEPTQGVLSSIFGSFQRLFWVSNAFELFERGAYYGTMSVLAVHVVNNLGIDRDTWGALYSFLIVLLYFVPLFSAALAEKIGFKLMLLVAFVSMIIGYTYLSSVEPNDLTALVTAFLFVGIGAGLFKPIISASIAHVTPEDMRNLAYSIYYWMINLGAVIAPLSIAFAFPDEALYYYVFFVSTGLVIINIIVLLTLFKNPVDPHPDLAVTSAIVRIVPALRDRSFIVLLTIYAGFWFMFAYNHTFLPNYMVDFGRMPRWFTAPFLATINPGTIVIVGPWLGKRIERFKSLNVMMFGMVIFIIGFGINGMSDTQGLFVTGVVIFSIGEFIVHPGFISYVSKIAPKDKVSIYLACIFVSTGLGQFVGGVVQGRWYQNYGYEQGHPQIYIALVMAVGMSTLVAFMLYNRWQIRQTLERDPKAKEDKGIWTKSVTMAAVVFLIPITVVSASNLPGMVLVEHPDDIDGVPDWSEYDILTGSQSFSDYAGESDASDTVFSITDVNVLEVTFTLTWTDEADSSPRHNNQPDEFALEVFAPDGRDLDADYRYNPSGGSGQVSITVDFEPDEDPYENGTGEWTVTVLCGECGDQTLWRPSAGVFDQPDNGNDWDLSVAYRYYQRPEQPA